MHSLLFVAVWLGASPDTTFLLEWTPPERPSLTVPEMEALCTRVLEGDDELDASTRAAILFRRAKLRGENPDRLIAGINDLELAHRLDPGDLDISASYALAQRIQGGTSAEFQEAAQRLVDQHPKQPHGYFLLGLYHYHNDDCRSAIEQFDEAVERDWEMTSAVAWRAVCHFNIKDDDAALKDVIQAMQMRPMLPHEQSRLFLIQGSVYARRQQYVKAIPILNIALSTHRDHDGIIRSVLWKCYVETAKYESALRVARDDVTYRPNDAVAHVQLALSLAHFGDLDGALRHCAEAIDLDEQNEACWKALGRIHAARGSFPDALLAFLKGQPSDAESAVFAAFLYAAAPEDSVRDGRKAVRTYELAARMFPNPVPPHLSLVGACCYAESGDFAKAVATAKAAVGLSAPESPIAESAKHLLDLFEKRRPYRLDRDRTARPFDLPVLEHVIPEPKRVALP